MVQQQQFPKITEEALADLRGQLNVESPIRDPFNRYASPDTIRHYAHGYGDANPLYTDEEYGQRTRWGCVIAPPTFFASCLGRGATRGLRGIHGLWAGVAHELERPVKAGTRIDGVQFLSAVDLKSSSFAETMVRQETTYVFRDGEGNLLGRLRQWNMRTERDAAQKKGKYKEVKPTIYTPEEVQRIFAEYDKEEVRGAVPRYWDDVKVGDETAPVIKGPLRVTDNIAWKIGWGFYPFAFAHRIAAEYMRRHPAAGIPNEYGVPDVPERVHWDDAFARRIGGPAAYDFGPQRAAWLSQVATNWMGDDAFARRYWCEVRRFNAVTDTHWLKGKVVEKRRENGQALVELELWGDNQRGETTIRGGATVVLPTRS